MMAGVGVDHKLLTKKKVTIQISDKATSLKTLYLQAVLRARHTKPCPDQP